MEFTVFLKNKLTNTDLFFDQEFDLDDIFPNEKHIFDLLIENLDIYNPEDYETVEDIITDYDDEIEKFIKITDIKGFNFDLDFSDTSLSDINELFDLDVDVNKLEAYAEFDGFMDVYKILHENWDGIYLYEDVDSNEELGYYYINSILGNITELSRKQLESYFDYEAFGRDLNMDTTGAFTKNGYLDANNAKY